MGISLGVFGWFGIVMAVIPNIMEIIRQAQKFFDGIPDSSVQKKEYAMAMIHEAVLCVIGVTDDNADALILQAETILSEIVDTLVKIFKKKI